MSLSIAFHGAARTVTGSRHLLRFGGRSMLFDCGLYQGHRDEAERVNRTFRFAPTEVDSVVVSHAHLDHTGNLPTLFTKGFDGPIHLTPATDELTRVMLEDSAFLMQKDVERVNRHASRNAPRRPLFTMSDVEATTARFESHAYHEPFQPLPGVTATYHDAGHILGSAVTMLDFTANGRTKRVCMGGDLGRPRRPILRDPESPAGADVLVLESTYGDRNHSDEATTIQGLVDVVQRTVGRGGILLVPAFAVGRTQELVATLHELTQAGRLPELPIFVDSPMARSATAIFVRHPECFDAETLALFRNGSEPFGFARLRYVGSADESRALNDHRGPAIIISASGMCEGGRVLHHLLHLLGDERNTVLFVGFQGDGTLGRRLHDGAESVNVFGEPVQVRAEIASLDGFSAHADQAELLAWVTSLRPSPRTIFLVHGEPQPAETLAGLLRARLPAEVHVPSLGEEFDLWT
jgi:metallo-beta-lactamase family protein